MNRLRRVALLSLVLCSVPAAAQEPLPGTEAAPVKPAEAAPVDAAPVKPKAAAKGKGAKAAKGAVKDAARPADAKAEAAPKADAPPVAEAVKPDPAKPDPATTDKAKLDAAKLDPATTDKAAAPAPKAETAHAKAKAEAAAPAAATAQPVPAPVPTGISSTTETPWWAEKLQPGFKLTVGLTGGMTVLNQVGYGFYYADTHTFETWDREYKRSFGLLVEAGWRFGAVSLGVEAQVFTAGSPAIFNRDLLVPITVGPRLEVAVGMVRLGTSGVLALNPKSKYLGMDGGFNADVGVQLGHFGVRLMSGVIFGIGTYPTADAQQVQSTHSTSLVPIHLSLLWDY